LRFRKFSLATILLKIEDITILVKEIDISRWEKFPDSIFFRFEGRLFLFCAI
jgi:hypothetical protein